MNERIRLLAEQARQYAEEKQNDPFRIYTLDCFNEKFAELIVQECVVVADHSNVTGKSIIGERIREHFGVEE
jgi:hypothetical protein